MRKWHRGKIPSPGGNLPSSRQLDAPFLLIHATFGYACCFVESTGSHLPALPVFSFAIIVLLFFKNSKRIFDISLLIFCRAALPPRFRAPYCPQGTEKAALRGKRRAGPWQGGTAASNAHCTRYPYSQLGNGCLTAHGVGCLVLLGSPPDTVHRAPLRKTESLNAACMRSDDTIRTLGRDFLPAVADCG